MTFDRMPAVFAHAVLALALLGCATNSRRTEQPMREQAMAEQDEVAVARVVGASIRERIHGEFVVLPRLFVHTALAHPFTSAVPTDQQLALLDGLRRGGSAQWADTSTITDSTRLASIATPLTARPRTVVTLAEPVVIDGDTARTSVYITGAGRRAGEPVYYTVEQYVVARSAGSSWHFVRRQLIYAT